MFISASHSLSLWRLSLSPCVSGEKKRETRAGALIRRGGRLSSGFKSIRADEREYGVRKERFDETLTAANTALPKTCGATLTSTSSALEGVRRALSF